MCIFMVQSLWMKNTSFKAFLITPPLSEAYLSFLPQILDSHSIDWIMYRDSSSIWIKHFLEILKPYNKKLFLNLPFANLDEITSLSEGFDGVHLKSSLFDSITRLASVQSFQKKLIGYSAHSVDEVCQAVKSGAHYCTLSPIFDTPSKGPALGLEVFKQIPIPLRIKVFALGGITLQNLNKLGQMGLGGFAAISYFNS